eukprot:Partr_v1_DN28522_c0_g1_i2_m73714 putative TAF5-like RNA polymerase II, p300 CBP-associated factor (PCAF)-associated factor
MSGRIHFGSLASQAAEITAANAQDIAYSAPTASSSSFVNPYLENRPQKPEMTAEKQRTLEELEERARRLKSIAVPTDDTKVRQFLREIREPMTLFGEGPYERRERLRIVLSERSDIPARVLLRLGAADAQVGDDQMMLEDQEPDEEFFTLGSDELQAARVHICKLSLDRARIRVKSQAEAAQGDRSRLISKRLEEYELVETFELVATQVGSERPLSAISISPSGSHLATGCFGGSLKLWDAGSCELVRAFKGHADRTCSIAWFPSGSSFASAASDGSISMWNVDNEAPVSMLDGHALRVTGLDVHPTGRYMASCSFDQSWRLWDVETGGELLLQEGHASEIYGVRFQYDGSLVATVGSDIVGRVWDLRSGRSILNLSGHAQACNSVDWSPNGFEVATASSDHTVRIHDLRQLKCSLHVIAAHENLVSSVRYRYNYEDSAHGMEVGNGDSEFPYLKEYQGSYLATCSFDGTARMWGHGDYTLLNTLAGHGNKIMALDVSRTRPLVATASYDRTFKIWTPSNIS